MNKLKKIRSLLIGSFLSLTFTLPVTAASDLQNSNTTGLEKSDKIALAHARKKQSTGSWKGNRDVHQNLPKGRKEVKRQSDDWVSRQGKKPNGNAAKRNSRSTSK
jgi:predicted glycoside hydrolase/deacetylase ChbG (UPF0249 family)